MKNAHFLRLTLASLVKGIGMAMIVVAILAGNPTIAYAANTTLTGPGLNYTPNMFYYGSVTGDFTTAYTNSTTTATVLSSASNAGMSVVIPATSRDISKQVLCVRYSVDGTKATSTTGAIQVNINGAIDTASTRYTGFGAGRNTISGIYCVQRASAAAQTISLFGVSGDTAAFTVQGAYMEVWNITQN